MKFCIRLSIFVGLLFACSCTPVIEEAPKPAKENPTEEPLKFITGAHESEACKPLVENEKLARSDCQEGLICMPDIYDPSKGLCRVGCEKEGEESAKDANKCPAGRVCQNIADAGLNGLGLFCLPQQKERDGQCFAIGDSDACTEGRSCSVAESERDDQKNLIISSLLCRATCNFGKADGAKACPSAGEICVSAPLDTVPQMNPKKPDEPLMCDVPKCVGGGADCECDVGNGFVCQVIIPGIPMGFCMKLGGLCAEPVAWATAEDFAGTGFSGSNCNQKAGHRYCDARPLDGLKNAAELECIEFPNQGGEGFCVAFCSAPALDFDGDGKISEQEQGFASACPPDFVCNKEMGRKIGFVKEIPDVNAPNEKKACDPSKCTAGQPCPGECGPGDAECLTLGKASFCGAPFGNCEPVKKPD